MAEGAGLHQPAVARMESGISNPRCKTIDAYANFLKARIFFAMIPQERCESSRPFDTWTRDISSGVAHMVDDEQGITVQLEYKIGLPKPLQIRSNTARNGRELEPLHVSADPARLTAGPRTVMNVAMPFSSRIDLDTSDT